MKFLAALMPLLEWLRDLLDNRLTVGRAAKLDNLDATVSSRAAASTALSTATWTNALATWLGGAARRKPVATIVGAYSIAGLTNYPRLGDVNQYSYVRANLARMASGSLTAGDLKTMIDIPSGAGVVRFLGVRNENGTGISRTLRLKLTIDGVVVFDVTTDGGVSSAYGYGMPAVGAFDFDATTGTYSLAFGNIEYDSSFKVEIASSTTSSTVAILYNYETRA